MNRDLVETRFSAAARLAWDPDIGSTSSMPLRRACGVPKVMGRGFRRP